MIEFQNVTQKYSTGYEALRRITLHISAGEMVFLTGHSGAGKSTLLKLITALEHPTRGYVLVNGKRLDKMRKSRVPHFRRSLGVVFQDPQLLSQRTVFENVALPLLITGHGFNDIGRNVRAALDMVGLLDKERRLPLSLSIGEQQRVGIARAIVNRPKILLADEPTGNLDPELSVEIMSLFDRLHEAGTTIMIASHNLTLIAALHHRILTLKQGVLVGDE